MEILLTIIHLAACFILIVIVLLQKGKGADLAGAFGGGGSQTTLGVRTSTQMIHRLTIAAAVFFMITSYTLGLLGSSGSGLAKAVRDQAEHTQSTKQQNKSEQPATPNEGSQQNSTSGPQGTGESNQTQQPESDNTPSGGTDQPPSSGNN
jgi:preprotein translocase subunit SecG